MAPRTVQALEAVPVLAQQTQQLHDELACLRRHAEDTARATAEIRATVEQARLGRIDALEAALTEVESGLAESRQLSLRVAQMTDLVFDRLLASSDGTPRT